MATLTGTKIQDTYDGLLKVSDNVGINSTKKIITDGLGNDSSVKISSQDFEVGGFFYIDIDGNVPNSKIGIGTSSPQQALHINGSIQVNGTYYDSSGEGGDYGEVLLALGSETNWTNRFVIGMIFSSYAQFVGYAEFQGGIKDYTGSFGTNGQVLMTTGSDIEWVSLSEISGVDGTGTANYIPIWNDADTIGNSIIYQDSSNIGIGTTTPGEKLEVVGNVEADEFIGDLRGAVLFKAQAGEALTKGEVVYISGISGNTTIVSKADANDSTKMPAFGLSAETVALNTSVDIYTFGTLSNLDTSAYSEGDELFVSTTAGALTNTAPTGESSLIQKVGKVTRSHATVGSIKIMGAGRTNSTPNLDTGKIFAGNSSNQAVTTDTIYVDIANSKVGIGTTSPISLLHLESASSPSLQLTDTSQTTTLKLYAQDSNTHIANTTSHDMVFDTANTERMRITSAGFIGIGTASPSTKLHVRNGEATIASDTDGVKLSYSNGNSSGIIDTAFSDNNLEFRTNGTAKMWIANAGNVGIGTISPSDELHVVGNIRWTGNATNAGNGNLVMGGGQIKFSDAGKLYMGDSNDLQLYHDGSNSYISQTGTGDLYIQQNVDDKDIIFQSDDGSGGTSTYLFLDGSLSMTRFLKEARWDDNVTARFGSGGDSRIFHDSVNTYFDNFTGDFYLRNYADDKDIIFQSDDGAGGTTEYFRLDGSIANGGTVYTSFPDLSVLAFGSSRDLRIYHSSTNSFINNAITGDLYIQQSVDDGSIYFESDNGTGGTTTYIQIDGTNVRTKFSKNTIHTDSIRANFGNSSDLAIYHDGSHSYLSNSTGNLYIQQLSDDSDIIFQSDDGSGGVTEYFRLDGSHTETKFSKKTKHLDNITATFGDTADLQIYHDGSNSYIADTNVGDLIITGTNVQINDTATGNRYLLAETTAGVKLYYGTSEIKFQTKTDGVEATGRTLISQSADSQGLQINGYDDQSASFAKMYVNSAGHTKIEQSTSGSSGYLQIIAENYLQLIAGTFIYTDDKIRIYDAGSLEFGNSGDYKLYYDSTGDVFNILTNDNYGIVIGNAGAIKFNTYGSGTNTGTATYNLAVDTNGNIIEVAASSGGVDGSGTANYISKWSDSDTLTDSIIYDDGTNIGIGTTSPGAKLHLTSSDETVARFERNSGSGYTVLDIKDGAGTTGNSVISFSDTGGTPGEINYEHADNSLRINTNSSERMRITSIGRVGIGTTSPSRNLHVVQSANSNTGVVVKNGNVNASASGGYRAEGNASYVELFATSSGYTATSGWADSGVVTSGSTSSGGLKLNASGGNVFLQTSATSGLELNSSQELKFNAYGGGTITGTAAYTLAVDSSGNVIETTASSGGIDGSGTANDVAMWSDSDTLTDAPIAISGNNATFAGQVTATNIYGETFRSARTDGDIYIQATSSTDFVSIGTQSAQNLLRVQGDGKVGIGTTSPATIFHISDATTPEVRIQDTTNNRYLSLYQNNSNSYIQTSLNSPLVFSTHGSNERMRITTAGNVGIGTTSPSRKLQVYQASSSIVADFRSASGTSSFISISNNTATADQIRFGSNGTSLTLSTNYAERFRISSTGNVGIGTTNPARKLDVAGDIGLTGDINMESAGDILLSPTSQLQIDGDAGTNGQVLTSTGTALEWQTPSGGSGSDTFVTNLAANHGSNSTSYYYVFRNKSNSSMIQRAVTWTSWSPVYYADLIMPSSCYLKKLIIRNRTGTVTATKAKMRIFKNTSTQVYDGSFVNATGSGSTTQIVFSLSSTDAAFSEGDAVQIGFNFDGVMAGMTAVAVFQLT